MIKVINFLMPLLQFGFTRNRNYERVSKGVSENVPGLAEVNVVLLFVKIDSKFLFCIPLKLHIVVLVLDDAVFATFL